MPALIWSSLLKRVSPKSRPTAGQSFDVAALFLIQLPSTADVTAFMCAADPLASWAIVPVQKASAAAPAMSREHVKAHATDKTSHGILPTGLWWTKAFSERRRDD